MGKLREATAQLARVVLNESLAHICTKYLSIYYRHLMSLQWGKGSPEWFDHRIDLYRWRDHLNPHWVERGVYSKEVMFQDCKVLDVACGDGLYPLLFYVSTGAWVDCIDINESAVAHAVRHNNHPQIRFVRSDAVRDDFPRTAYDVISFDGAMDHFSQAQLDMLFPKIKRALGGTGIFVGYQEIGFRLPDDEHPTCFATRAELVSKLLQHFRYVGTVITETPGRKNAYFRCSDDKDKVRRNVLVESDSESIPD